MPAGPRRSAARPAGQFCVVFFRGRAVNVVDIQRFHVNERSHFERADAIVFPIDVVPRGLITVEASRVDCGVTSAFLGESAEKRTVRLHRDLFEPVAESGEMRKARKPDFFEDAGHLAEEIDCLAVRLSQLNSQSLQREHRPLGEPATPFGVGGFVRFLDNVFSFRNRFSGEEAKIRIHNTLPLHFLRI